MNTMRHGDGRTSSVARAFVLALGAWTAACGGDGFERKDRAGEGGYGAGVEPGEEGGSAGAPSAGGGGTPGVDVDGGAVSEEPDAEDEANAGPVDPSLRSVVATGEGTSERYRIRIRMGGPHPLARESSSDRYRVHLSPIEGPR